MTMVKESTKLVLVDKKVGMLDNESHGLARHVMPVAPSFLASVLGSSVSALLQNPERGSSCQKGSRSLSVCNEIFFFFEFKNTRKEEIEGRGKKI